MNKRATTLVFPVCLLAACMAQAEVHYVSETSPAPRWPYTTPDTAAGSIHSAMSAASCGDTVLVLPGTTRTYGTLRAPCSGPA